MKSIYKSTNIPYPTQAHLESYVALKLEDWENELGILLRDFNHLGFNLKEIQDRMIMSITVRVGELSLIENVKVAKAIKEMLDKT